MKSPDPRDFGLSPRQCERLQRALQPGEQLRWAGSPIVRHPEPDKGNRVVGVLFFLPFGLAGAGCIYGALAGTSDESGSLVGLFFAGMIFLLGPIGALIIYPCLHRKELRSRAYAITNRRAIVCGVDTESWPLAPDMVASEFQTKDGSGNLVFAVRARRDGGPGWNEAGFMDIRDVRLVEEILEKAIAERKNV